MKTIFLTLCLAAMSAGAQTNTHHIWSDYTFTNLQTYQITLGGGGGLTNIIIWTNYTGTVQIGTNFYTLKDLDDLNKGKTLKH